MDIAADTASDIQLAAETGGLAAARRTGLSTIPEEPAEAPLTASTGAVAEQAPAEEEVQRRRSPEKSAAAKAAPESGVQGSPHTAGKAKAASQGVASLSDSEAALQERQSSAAADSPPADGGLEALGPQPGRGSAKELLPLPVLTGSSSLTGIWHQQADAPGSAGRCHASCHAHSPHRKTDRLPALRTALSMQSSPSCSNHTQEAHTAPLRKACSRSITRLACRRRAPEHVRPATLVRSKLSAYWRQSTLWPSDAHQHPSSSCLTISQHPTAHVTRQSRDKSWRRDYDQGLHRSRCSLDLKPQSSAKDS